MFHSGRHHRRASDTGLLNSFDELGISSLEILPQELLLQIFEHLVDPSLITAGFPEKEVFHHVDIAWQGTTKHKPICRKDLRNVCLVSWKFKLAATTLLYRCAHLATAKSPGTLVLSLATHPHLQPLVKHISVPACCPGRNQFNFAFSHDTYNRTFDDVLNHDWQREFNPVDDDFFARSGEYFRGDSLRLMVSLVPNLQSLVIPQRNLLDGPFTKDLILCNLVRLRITLMTSNDVLFWVEDVDYSTAVRTIAWLSPGTIGQRFPGLRRLEIHTRTGRWEADLITEEADAWPPLKFVESLTTTTMDETAAAEWDLVSLKQPIFHASKLRTLKFDGAGKGCIMTSNIPKLARWDLNRFLDEKGGGLRTLSLDWECYHIELDHPYYVAPQTLYFGPAERLITLNKLTNLTHLTVSLQALFWYNSDFNQWVIGLEMDPDTELSKLFPPSLKTLRIAEFVRGVYQAWPYTVGDIMALDIFYMRKHSDFFYSFLQILRSCWMPSAEGRELWIRRHTDLDEYAAGYEDHLGRDRLASILGNSAEDDGDLTFVRVLGLHEYTWENGETMAVSDLESTEN